MKGRSYRFSSLDPHEDWVDGSWTVDCPCGVDFDDGEEMVNCDDCGIWVHTRCSRYVKEEEHFTCDKCKSKNNVNNSTETEIAELLVEFPRMENASTRVAPKKRPYRLWTEIPIEEKVHVQGVPGGDPALFKGLSSVFSQQLWKCTGYVPKQFNFKYREFPCWDEQEKNETENGQQEENGAGVLFSMSKENAIAAPSSAVDGMRGLDDAKDVDSGKAEVNRSQSVLKKDKNLLRPGTTNKRRKELFGSSKERKKKVEVAGGKDKDKRDRKKNDKRRVVGKTVAIRSSNASKPSESRKDIEPGSFTSDFGIIKSGKSKKAAFEESVNGGHESGNIAIGAECSSEQNLSDVHANAAGKQEEKAGHHFRIVLKSSAISDPTVHDEKDVPHNEANKDERQGTTASENNAIDSPDSFCKPSPVSTSGTTRDIVEKNCMNVGGIIGSRKKFFQKEVVDTGAGGKQTLDPIDPKVAVTQSSSLSDDHRQQRVDMILEGTSSGNRDKASEQKLVFPEAEKDILETNPGSGLLQEPVKACRPVPHTVSGYGRPKMLVCIGKSSSSSATEKSDNPKPSSSRNSTPGSKQQPSDDAFANANDEDCVSSDVIREKDGDDEPSQKAPKYHPKYSTKLMQHNRISHSSLSKTRESSSSSKAASSTAQVNGSSGTLKRSEKHGQSIFQSSSTKNPMHAILALTPNMSDEELALRLHHQLNSSPRVPRVPRLRQPGGLPLSPTGTSFKRTSSSGNKDHATFSRRKNKDSSKESSRSFRDDERCSTRSTKTRRSPDGRTQQDSGSRRGNLGIEGEENETLKTSSYSSRKVHLSSNLSTSTSSGPSSSNDLNEQNMPSPHSSPRNNGTPVHRTLPGLINEIMSKGQRMTYEELCNAVLPHWPHLRKHNGERYAYASHSQAVLDCLRNRHEWARLVDRGPKTNSGKKKRKLDEEEESDEKESSLGGRKRLTQHHSQGEEFPKGKRKARKRRRLSLQGKGLKMLRKKINEEDASEDDDEGTFSDTSQESVFSEDEGEEEEGGPTSTAAAGEVSASSSEEAPGTS